MISYPDGLSTTECCHKVASALGHRVTPWKMQQIQTSPVLQGAFWYAASSGDYPALAAYGDLSHDKCKVSNHAGEQSDAAAELQPAPIQMQSDGSAWLAMVGMRVVLVFGGGERIRTAE